MTWENDIWARMRKMQRQLDSSFSNLWNSSGEYFRKAWAEFDENDKEFILNVELPGIDKKDIVLEVRGRTLEIKAQKKRELVKEDKEKGFKGFSRDYIGFARSVGLPEEADVDNVDSSFKNGILTVRIPKKKNLVKKKLIQVK